MSASAADLPVDGRQSPTALAVARGTARMLAGLGFTTLAELTLGSGRRADLVGLGADGTIWIVEIKSSLADLRADSKWPDYRRHCDRLYFAIPTTMPPDVMPSDAGLIVADAYGAAILRDPDEHRMPAATRRALTLHFARAAAARLHGLFDPGAVAGIE